MVCSQHQLNEFSFRHYAYINQIFAIRSNSGNLTDTTNSSAKERVLQVKRTSD